MSEQYALNRKYQKKEFIPHNCKVCKKEIPRDGRQPAAYNKIKTCSPVCKAKAQEGTVIGPEQIRRRKLKTKMQNETKASPAVQRFLQKSWPKCNDYPSCIEIRLRLHYLRERVKKACEKRKYAAISMVGGQHDI